jgi:hypothetical protein
VSPPTDPDHVCYLILGLAGSGRREVLIDLLSSLEPSNGPIALLTAAGEASSEADARLAALLTLSNWSLETREKDGMKVPFLVPEIPEGTRTLFILADGRAGPIDFIEGTARWLSGSKFRLARVLTVVNCAIAEREPSLAPWFEACIHFSDYILLNRREGVSNKWMSEFQRHYKEACHPGYFEFVKQGRVRNPAFVLLPEARRPSHVFDFEEREFEDELDAELMIETEDGDLIPVAKADMQDDEEAEQDPLLTEIYFLRTPSGKRLHALPDVSKIQ